MVGGGRRVRGGFGSVAAGGRGSFERDGVRVVCGVPACVTADARRSGPGPSVTEAAVSVKRVPMGLTADRVLSFLGKSLLHPIFYIWSTLSLTMKPSVLPPKLSKTVYFTQGRFSAAVLLQ